MKTKKVKIEELWEKGNFRPNKEQEKAIRHTEGPLFLPAGPGSGKTRVLLWRAVNLIVCRRVPPEDIFLSTFTEKAALQLKEGIRVYLGIASNITGEPYDISRMYIGTVHSLCQRITRDRQFTRRGIRPEEPHLLDELAQYFYVYRTKWDELTEGVEVEGGVNRFVNSYFGRSQNNVSKHEAVGNCIAVFNRFSEECFKPPKCLGRCKDECLSNFLELYAGYLRVLKNETVPYTDFSLLQQEALEVINSNGSGESPFRHVIIDEYQDTNGIQEKIFFALAQTHGNICVVGDDDQALYRFRGATVENFVEFPERCEKHLGKKPKQIPLGVNYRSQRHIVDFCNSFITHPYVDWKKEATKGYYRITEKNLRPNESDERISVIASTPGCPEDVCEEIADLVTEILDSGKVQDPNQIAFLYPSLKSNYARTMIKALENRGLLVYAPRAKTFLETDEAFAIFGLFLEVFGLPESDARYGGKYDTLIEWAGGASRLGKKLREEDTVLNRYIEDRQLEIEGIIGDFHILKRIAEKKGWGFSATYIPGEMEKALVSAKGLSQRAIRSITSGWFKRHVENRLEIGNRPFRLGYVINRASSLDWTVLDLFYQLCGFKYFRRIFDKAEGSTGDTDEGPICNLGLISQYIARFIDDYGSGSIITGSFLEERKFANAFFGGYLYALFRLGESEYEYAEDPFPRGRIPFITIHQAKGLEFPIVILGNPRKDTSRPQIIEKLVQPLLNRKGEPLGKMPIFDAMRMFYVALSRAENLLVIAHYKGSGHFVTGPFKTMLNDDFPRIPDFDIGSLERATARDADLPKSYSFTGDYLSYRKCPRQYMVFKKYGFVPSRSQTMFFGSLVHRTIEDLHRYLISRKGE
jgi:DNA helicase-2/ATP-dependent DNA helicase PcrA